MFALSNFFAALLYCSVNCRASNNYSRDVISEYINGTKYKAIDCENNDVVHEYSITKEKLDTKHIGL